MERPHPPMKENKLLLLYAFEKVGAMTNQQAMRFVMENNIMEYLDLQLSLAELTDSGLLQVLPLDESRYYTLTSKAQQTLAFFSSQVPASRLARVDEIAEQWRDLFQQEKLMTCDYVKNSFGDYTVRLTAREHGITLVDITLNVPTHSQAISLCSNWSQRAADAYRVLMESLTGENASPEKK